MGGFRTGGVRRWGTCAVLLLMGRHAQAADLGAPDQLLSVELHGFVSQGFIYSTGNNYLARSTRGSFEFSEAAINVTKSFNDRLRLGAQLFSRDLGPVGNYTARFDWYYLDYRVEDWFGLRAGRVKMPFGLYNESSDIDAARVPVLLPQSVYPTLNRDFLLALSGAEVYGYLYLGALGALDYRLYAGTIFVDRPTPNPQAAVNVVSIDTPYLGGARLLWETPLQGLRMGGSVQALRLDLVAAFPDALVSVRLPAVMWVASVEYSANAWLLAAEYSRWSVRYFSDDPVAVPYAAVTSERGYLMASRRFNDWFAPGVYYSVFFRDFRDRTLAGTQQDLAVFLRFDVNAHWLVKVEGHVMRGMAGLDPSLNDRLPRAALVPNWGAFFVKTTGSF